MINCIVVDDEPLARELMVSYIEQVPELTCTGQFGSAIEAFAALHAQPVDVILLDIDMPGINGLSFIRSLKKSPRVIFTTAYTEYAVEAFELEATDYLVKPVTFERFLKAIQKVGWHNTQLPVLPAPETTAVFLKIDRRLVKFNLADIIYAEGLGDYLKIHTTGQPAVTYMTLHKLETLLPAARFVRIHRSIIVNTDYIQFIEGNMVKAGQYELPIGLTYREQLIKRIS